MKVVQLIALVSGVIALAIGYFLGGYPIPAYWLLSLGVIWLFAEFRGTRWAASPAFWAGLVVAGYGLWIDLSLGWMLAGAFGGLMVWNLSDFQHRILRAAPADDVKGLTRRHLIRLLVVTTLGLFFSLSVSFLEDGLSFSWMVFLVILATLGVLYIFNSVRRGSNHR